MTGDKRLVFITIDGDGFIYRTNYDNRYVGEVFLEEIIKKYPFLFTASISTGDIFKYSSEFDVGLIKRIFRSDNIEIGSHGWDHPNDWQMLNDLDIKHEIFDSVDFINRHLLSPDKKTKMFLWTGLCNPTEKALRLVEDIGISNLNGFGDKKKPFMLIGSCRHFISRVDMDFTYMGLKGARERLGLRGYYETLRLYKGKLDGLKKVVEYYKTNSNLPIHLWLHWYSVVRRESLDALHYVLRWFLTQDIEPVFASEYINRIYKDKGISEETSAYIKA